MILSVCWGYGNDARENHRFAGIAVLNTPRVGILQHLKKGNRPNTRGISLLPKRGTLTCNPYDLGKTNDGRIL